MAPCVCVVKRLYVSESSRRAVPENGKRCIQQGETRNGGNSFTIANIGINPHLYQLKTQKKPIASTKQVQTPTRASIYTYMNSGSNCPYPALSSVNANCPSRISPINSSMNLII